MHVLHKLEILLTGWLFTGVTLSLCTLIYEYNVFAASREHYGFCGHEQNFFSPTSLTYWLRTQNSYLYVKLVQTACLHKIKAEMGRRGEETSKNGCGKAYSGLTLYGDVMTQGSSRQSTPTFHPAWMQPSPSLQLNWSGSQSACAWASPAEAASSRTLTSSNLAVGVPAVPTPAMATFAALPDPAPPNVAMYLSRVSLSSRRKLVRGAGRASGGVRPSQPGRPGAVVPGSSGGWYLDSPHEFSPCAGAHLLWLQHWTLPLTARYTRPFTLISLSEEKNPVHCFPIFYVLL